MTPVGIRVRARHPFEAIVGLTRQAIGTLAAGIDVDAHTRTVPYREIGNVTADGDYLTDDFVAWNDGEFLVSPIASHQVNVRMAHARVGDGNLNIAGSDLSSLKVPRNKIGPCVMGGESSG